MGDRSPKSKQRDQKQKVAAKTKEQTQKKADMEVSRPKVTTKN